MNLIEINSTFPSEKDCVNLFEDIRWLGNPQCPYCGSEKVSERKSDYRRYCNGCRKSFSVTTGTNIEGTKIPYKTWLYAFSIISDAKKGLSALQLQRNLDLSYPTAWSMYHKIREFMQIENNHIELLDEVVEMDETFVGGKPRKPNNPVLMEGQRLKLDTQIKQYTNEGFSFKPLKGNPAKVDLNVKRGRGSQKMIPVVGIAQRDGNVIAEVMKTLTHKNLKKMVEKYVDTDEALLITDAYKGYSKMEKIIDHVVIDHKVAYSYKGVNTNSIESFWAIIKRGIMGQYHHVSAKHLPKYVSEFVFKYNNRREDNMFDNLLKNALAPNSL
jgi:transposase-like protein